jgi:hypothetical protein
MVSFSTNVGWVPKDIAPILDKRNQSAYNEPAYRMQGIEHIVPSPDRYLCWWTISPRCYHLSSKSVLQYFHDLSAIRGNDNKDIL